MNDKAQFAAIGAELKADRAMEVFERMSPHQMAVLIVDQQDDYYNMVEQRDAAIKLLRDASEALKDYVLFIEQDRGMGKTWSELVAAGDKDTELPLRIDSILSGDNK